MLKQMNKRRNNIFVLTCCCVAFTWLFGLLVGKWIASGLSVTGIDFARSIVSGRGSLTFLLLRSVLPVIAVLLLAHRGRKGYILPVVFLKALLLNFSVCIMMRAFDSAGWLVSVLVFFTDFLSCYLCVFCVLYSLCTEKKVSKRFCTTCFVLCSLVAVFDYFVILPFVVSLFR